MGEVQDLQGGNGNSNITLSQEPPNDSAETAASANGPLAPALPDLNVLVGPPEHSDPLPLRAQEHHVNGPLYEDPSLAAILQHHSEPIFSAVDPMQLEVSNAVLVSKVILISPATSSQISPIGRSDNIEDRVVPHGKETDMSIVEDK